MYKSKDYNNDSDLTAILEAVKDIEDRIVSISNVFNALKDSMGSLDETYDKIQDGVHVLRWIVSRIQKKSIEGT